MSHVLQTLVLLACAAAPPAAPAPKRPVLAVLYFDNDSGKPELDILQKGLADMLVTDIAAAQMVQVVERQKLQSLIDELDLQRSKFFDPATAVRLGKIIGATHAVTGSFHSFEPTLRIDVRLIEIATSKVVLADSVTGTKDQFFELEQEVARRFLKKLDGQLGGAPARTQGADFESLVAYSKGLDLQDHGQLDQAARALAAVALRAPQFALASDRQKEILLALEALARQRSDVLSGQSEVLLKNADAYLSSHDPVKLKGEAARTHLAYRLVRGRYILFLLELRLGKGDPRCALEARDADVKALMQSYLANGEALVREAKVLAKPVGTGKLLLPAADAARARTLGLGDSEEREAPLATSGALEVARFTLEGRTRALAIWPPLAILDSRAAGVAAALADQASAEYEASGQPDRGLDSVDTKARGLLAVGRTEDAAAAWKEGLQRFPASRRYRELEARVKDTLGLSAQSKQRLEDARWYERTIKSCRQDELERAAPYFGKQRATTEGLFGWRRTVIELDRACGANPGLAKLYAEAGAAAAAAGDCGYFDKLTAMMERVDRSAAWALKGEVHCEQEGQDAPSEAR